MADAIKYFKKIKFYITYIIISGSLFNEFISKLKTVINEIFSVPKIIIFTSEITKAKIAKSELINNSFYNIGGIVVKFEDVLSFLNKNFYNKNLNFIRPLRREIIQAEGEFSFEILDNKKDLLGLIYLNDFYEKPEEKACLNFEKYLIDNYGDIMSELISQIFNVDYNYSFSLRIKYWLRAYTLETKFYKDMNSDLMKEKIKLYIPYIRLLYSGLKENLLNFNISNNLYRGALISIGEIQNLINFINRKCIIISSKAFMSFSLDRNIAMNFMKKKKNTEKTFRDLYILKAESKIDHNNATNADLRGISYFEDEREILLFPFSFFEISDILRKENYYEIYLNYLGKYKELFHFENKSILEKEIVQSKYYKMLQSKGLFLLILVTFISCDNSIVFPFVYNLMDKFSNLEERLFHEFPQLKDKIIYFVSNGREIKRSNTIMENNIKNGIKY